MEFGLPGFNGRRGRDGKNGAVGATGQAGATGQTGATGGSFEPAFISVFNTDGINTGAGGIVPFDTVTAEENLLFDGSGSFTIQLAGAYKIDFFNQFFSIFFSSSLFFYVSINGSPTGNIFEVGETIILNLNTGDVVTINTVNSANHTGMFFQSVLPATQMIVGSTTMVSGNGQTGTINLTGLTDCYDCFAIFLDSINTSSSATFTIGSDNSNFYDHSNFYVNVFILRTKITSSSATLSFDLGVSGPYVIQVVEIPDGVVFDAAYLSDLSFFTRTVNSFQNGLIIVSTYGESGTTNTPLTVINSLTTNLGDGTGVSYYGYIDATGSSTTVSITPGPPTTLSDSESYILSFGVQLPQSYFNLTITKVG